MLGVFDKNGNLYTSIFIAHKDSDLQFRECTKGDANWLYVGTLFQLGIILKNTIKSKYELTYRKIKFIDGCN